MRTRIKICGVTSVDIAAYAVQCGADAIGLNFYPGSSRYIDTDLGVAISRNMAPFVSRVGVFADADRDFIISVVERVELDYLQFHGDESVQFCTSFDRPYVKAIRVSDDTDTDSIAAEFSTASAILLDTFSPDAYGGTGEPFNWELATMNSAAPVILAGGLNPENVRLAIRRVSPYAVDVSSGVESDGAKDPEKIQKFCQNVYALI